MDRMGKIHPREIWTAMAGALAEWLFAVLPLLVVAIVLLSLGKADAMFKSPEWAFGASVLAGQALVRFVAGVARARKLSLQRVLFGVSALLVAAVVPANVILALVMMGHEQHEGNGVSLLLSTAQASLFLVASVVFTLVASISHLWTNQTKVADNDGE